MRHHVYLSPGFFGFGRLGSYNYFGHVERELVARFEQAGVVLVPHVVEVLPTASIRRRATRLAEIVSKTSAGEPVHLLGHSTGGLDARLVASPATRAIPAALLGWLPELRSVTAMNTPHFGTPLASFFTTSQGQRVLEALSVLTMTGLSIGEQPLAAASMILAFLRGIDKVFPFKLTMLERAIENLVGMVDDARSPEILKFLAAIGDDQGALMQLSPESMDLVVAGFEDRPGVVYQSTASMAPSPRPQRWLDTVGHPLRTVSLSLFFALHRITAAHDPRYPCAAMTDTSPDSGPHSEAMLARVFGAPPPPSANDGVVPIRSQLWGKLVWAGLADHLDVLGHYKDDRDPAPADPGQRHCDWLTSSSDFRDADFAALMDAIAAGMLAAR